MIRCGPTLTVCHTSLSNSRGNMPLNFTRSLLSGNTRGRRSWKNKLRRVSLATQFATLWTRIFTPSSTLTDSELTIGSQTCSGSASIRMRRLDRPPKRRRMLARARTSWALAMSKRCETTSKRLLWKSIGIKRSPWWMRLIDRSWKSSWRRTVRPLFRGKVARATMMIALS